MVNENLAQLGGNAIELYKTSEAITSKAIKVKSVSYEEEDPTIVTKLQELVDSGKSKTIEALVFGEWKESWEEEAPFLNYLIENKSNFPNLKHFFSGDMTYEECEMSWIIQTNYNAFLREFSHLESFGVQGGNELRFGMFRLPNLKEFRLFSGGTAKETIQDIINSNSFQNLEYLEIWFGTDDYGATVELADIKQLLDLEMPNLKHLGLKNSDLQNEIVALLANHPIVKQLETVDISMGILKNEGGEILLQGAFDHINHINCSHHFMSEELTEKVKQHFGDKITITEPEDDDNGEWFYVEVGE